MSEYKNCLVEIRSLYPSMYDTEKRIADFILERPGIIVNMTVAQISKEINVAESSIVRFCQKLGFKGFTQLKINIAQNLEKPEALIFQDIGINDVTPKVASKVFAAGVQALTDTIGMLNMDEMDRAVNAMADAKRIEFYGVGTSATLAMDAYYRFMRIGLRAYAATDPHISRISASMLDTGCVAVGISHTGRTKDTIETVKIAREKGAKTICITSFIKSPLYELCDIRLVTSTSETRFMKEAMSSRIAQISLLDSLYTCVALKKHDSAVERIKMMTEILNEMRYE